MKTLVIRPEPDEIIILAFIDKNSCIKAYREIISYDNPKKIIYKGLWWEIGDKKLPDIIMAKPKELEVLKDVFFKNYGNGRFDMTTVLSSFNSAMRDLEFRDYVIIYRTQLEEDTEENKIKSKKKK